MAGRNPDPYRKGGPHDDVANNIRAEMNRDAAPSPAEAREEHRRYLAEQGCEVCGDDDPDELGTVMPYVPGCPALQSNPDARGRVFCQEHVRSPREFWWARIVHRARNHGAEAIAVYGYEATKLATKREFPSEAFNAADSWSDIPPDWRPEPEVPIRCDCGAGLEEIRFLGGDG